MRTTTWAELVARVADRAEVSKVAARAVVDALVEAVTEATAKGTRVPVPGLGVFRRAPRRARDIVSPATKERIRLPRTSTLAFRAGKSQRRSEP